MISSGAGLFGVYGYGAYAPSKFAVRGLAETLRVELAPHGIIVTVAYPPDTATPQLAAEYATKPEATRRITAGGGVWQPDAVAARIVRAALQGRFVSTQGFALGALALCQGATGAIHRARQSRIVARLTRERSLR